MKRAIARAADVAPGGLLGVLVDGIPVCIAHTDAGFFAVNDNCTHEDCPLSDGELHGFEVECPCHGSRFDVRTGDVLTLPALEPVEVYPVAVEDGTVIVSIPVEG